MKRNTFKNDAQKGFTLVEMIIVLIILAILAAITVPSLVGYITKMHTSACELTRQNLKTAYESVIATEKNSGIEPRAGTFEWEVKDALRLSDHADLLKDENGDGVPDGVNQITPTILEITGLCGDNVVTAMRWRDGSLHLGCKKHGGDELDPSGAIAQGSEFEAEMNKWIAEHGNLIDKGDFYAEYYKTHEAVKVPEELRAALTNFEMYGTVGGNTTLLGKPMYWWTYPQTDKFGNVLFTVTYLNSTSDTSRWQGSYANIRGGYAVQIDGVIYVRKTGKCVEPGSNSTSKYPTKEEYIQYLIASGYEVMPFP